MLWTYQEKDTLKKLYEHYLSKTLLIRLVKQLGTIYIMHYRIYIYIYISVSLSATLTCFTVTTDAIAHIVSEFSYIYIVMKGFMGN